MIEPSLCLLALALVLDLVWGGFLCRHPMRHHPVRVMGRAVEAFNRYGNHRHHGMVCARVIGFVGAVTLILMAAIVGWVVEHAILHNDRQWLQGILIAFIALHLAPRELHIRMADIGQAMQKGNINQARDGLKHLVGRKTQNLSSSDIARATIESGFENFVDGVLSPVFWYVCGGVAGLCAFKMASTLDSMIGYRTPPYRHFGWGAARIDDVLTMIPARLSVVWIAFASLFVARCDGWRALKCGYKHGHKHDSFNAGYSEAAAGGALNVALGGTRHYQGRVVRDPFIGGDVVTLTHRHVSHALVLYQSAWICLLVTFASFCVV